MMVWVMLKITTVLLVTLSLTGCASKPFTPTKRFNPSELEWANASGSGVLSGQAFLKTVAGDVKTCAGNPVRLIPHSSYSAERIQYLYGNLVRGFNQSSLFSSKTIVNPDPRFYGYIRETVCDAQGEFKFGNIPDGTYYITTHVLWKVSADAYSTEGGVLMKRVNVPSGSNQKHILSH